MIMDIVIAACIGAYFVFGYMAAYYSGAADAGTEQVKRLSELISGLRAPSDPSSN